MTGKYSGTRAGHHGIDRDFFDRVLPGLAKIAGPHATDDLVRKMACPLEHGRDEFLRRQHNG